MDTNSIKVSSLFDTCNQSIGSLSPTVDCGQPDRSTEGWGQDYVMAFWRLTSTCSSLAQSAYVQKIYLVLRISPFATLGYARCPRGPNVRAPQQLWTMTCGSFSGRNQHEKEIAGAILDVKMDERQRKERRVHNGSYSIGSSTIYKVLERPRRTLT
jgi:hypothetical protein